MNSRETGPKLPILQNRVTPQGDVVHSPAGYTRFGNRGVLDKKHELLHQSKKVEWIICVTKDCGGPETFMQGGRMTELFFLDEATALAAGHRPCFLCSGDRAREFFEIWGEVNGTPKPLIGDVDPVLRVQRLEDDGITKKTYRTDAELLPDGVFIRVDAAAYLLHGEKMHLWSHEGYERGVARQTGEAEVLTPRTTVAVIDAGFAPVIEALPSR